MLRWSTSDLSGRRVLLVLAGWDDNVVKSFRNLGDVHLLRVDQLNTYDVLASDVVVFEQDALDLVGAGRHAGSPATEEVTQG
jgi:large subunit ribosomal protein L4